MHQGVVMSRALSPGPERATVPQIHAEIISDLVVEEQAELKPNLGHYCVFEQQVGSSLSTCITNSIR